MQEDLLKNKVISYELGRRGGLEGRGKAWGGGSGGGDESLETRREG